MDFQYSCGHSRKGGTGATIHETCPACGKGALLGVRGKITVNREDLQAMVDAMKAVKPLTRKEQLQPEQEPVADRIMELGNQVHNLACEVQYDEVLAGELEDIRARLWDLGGKVRKAREREEVVFKAADLISAEFRTLGSAEAIAEHLYDAGMLRKAGDQ